MRKLSGTGGGPRGDPVSITARHSHERPSPHSGERGMKKAVKREGNLERVWERKSS